VHWVFSKKKVKPMDDFLQQNEPNDNFPLVKIFNRDFYGRGVANASNMKSWSF